MFLPNRKENLPISYVSLQILMSWTSLIKLKATVFITGKRLFRCSFSLRISQKIQRRGFQILASFPKAQIYFQGPPNLSGSNFSLILLKLFSASCPMNDMAY